MNLTDMALSSTDGRTGQRWTTAVGAGLLLASALFTLPLWVQLARVAVSWHTGSPVDLLGRDFAVFHTAGRLALEGRWHDVYDPARFAAVYNGATGLALPAGGPVFPYPPFTALALIPLTSLSLGPGLAVWTAIGALLLFGGLRLLGGSWWSGLVVLLTVPAFAAVRLGQNTLFAVAVLAVAYLLHTRGRPLSTGLVVGLLVLKPQLAVGFALWWLAAPARHRRELTGMSITVAGVLLPSLVAAGEGWRAYLAHFSELTNPSTVLRTWYWSAWDFAALLAPGRNGLATAFWAVVAVAAIVLIVVGTRRSDELGFVAAVVTSLLITPHLVVYDWTLLVVPALVLWHLVPRVRSLVLGVVGMLALVAIAAADLTARQLDAWGRAFSPAFPALVVGVVLVVAALIRLGHEPGGEASEESPVHPTLRGVGDASPAGT